MATVITGKNVRIRHKILYSLLLSNFTGKKGSLLRKNFLLKKVGSIHPSSFISYNVSIISSHNLFIGEDSRINNYCHVDARGKINIGNNSLIGYRSVIISKTHKHDDPDLLIKDQGFYESPVTIGDNVWIGCNSIILPGVSIGDNSIIAAGSCVSSDVKRNEIVGGVPSKLIKSRL